MREEYDTTRNTSGAIVEGLGRTGRLVTSAALILFLSFLALASAPSTDIPAMPRSARTGVVGVTQERDRPVVDVCNQAQVVAAARSGRR